MSPEVLQKRVQEQSVSTAFQISKRQIHKQDGSFLIGLLTSYKSVAGLKQDLARIAPRSYEAGILKITILVAPQLDLEGYAGGNGCTTLQHGGGGGRMEWIVFAGRYLQLTDDCVGARNLAPLNGLVTKLVVERVVHSRQIGQPGTPRCVGAIQREGAGIVDQHECSSVGHKMMQSGYKEIAGLLVD